MLGLPLRENSPALHCIQTSRNRFTMKIYVGNLPMDIVERDLDDMFGRYGRIRYIELKVPARPPAFAFIEPVLRAQLRRAGARRHRAASGGGSVTALCTHPFSRDVLAAGACFLPLGVAVALRC